MTSAAETAQLRSFQCDICMTKLPADTNAYVAHMKMHASSMSLKCSFCSQVFQGPQKLKAHMQKVHASETNEPESLKTEATPVNALPGSMSTSSKTGVPMGGLPEDVIQAQGGWANPEALQRVCAAYTERERRRLVLRASVSA